MNDRALFNLLAPRRQFFSPFLASYGMKQKKSSSYKFRVGVYPTTSNFSLSTDVVWANYNLRILVNACCIHIEPASVFLRFFVLSQPTNKSRRTFFFFNPQLVFFQAITIIRLFYFPKLVIQGNVDEKNWLDIYMYTSCRPTYI